MDTIKIANKIIKKGIDLMPDDMKASFTVKAGKMFIYEAINNACGMVNGDAEKEALLGAYAVQEANNVVSTLWREEILPKDLEEEYRTLPKMSEMAGKYNEFLDDRKARLDKVMEQYNAIHGEEKVYDIFKGVINGVDKATAEKKYEEYEKQKMQAVAGSK